MFKKIKRIIKHFFVPHRGNAFRPHALRHKSLSSYLFAILIIQLAFGVTLYSGPEVKGVDSERLKKEIILLTNVERERFGGNLLYENKALNLAAQMKLEDMFKKNYWDHTGPNGEAAWDFIVESGYQYELAGENLARGFSDSREVMGAWMKSPTHKENIINHRFQEIGLAVGSGRLNGMTTTVIVQIFGRPKTALASAPKETSVVFAEETSLAPSLNLENVTTPSKAPYLVAWILILGLIILDGLMLRRLGLHTSKKHLAHFRVSLTMSLAILMVLSLGVAAVT